MKIGKVSRTLVFLIILIGFVGIGSAATISINPGDSIQAAINAATSGDTISVAAGVYTEDLVINKTIELFGADKTTTIIKGITNVLIASWPLAVPNIDIQEDDIKIHGFTIQGPDYVAGKYVSGLLIDGINVEIYDNNFVTVKAENTDELGQAITTYSKTAIPTADVSGLNIHDNTFTGSGSVGTEAIYINPHTGSGTITIENNEFLGSIFIGISAESGNLNLINNAIHSNVDSWYGIRVFDSNKTSTYDNIFVTGNTIQGFDIGGIRVGNSGVGTSIFVVSILSNNLSNNNIGIWAREGSQVTATDNSISGNTIGIQNDYTNTLNAENNWWGHITGPGGVGPGEGDSVSTNVDFNPWLVTLGGIDTEKPESHIILTGTQYVTSFAFNLPYVASDNYGLKRVRLYENGLGPVLYDSFDPLYPLSTSGTFSRTVVADGTYTYYTRAVDIRDTAYGGAEDAPLTPDVIIIVDTMAPTGTVTRGTPIISYNDLIQEITINYNEQMDSSYTPMINFTNNIGEIRSQGDGTWATPQIWTESFLVEDADEETSGGVVVTSSLARDIAGNLEGTSISTSFNIDTKAPVISDLDNSTTDVEINNDNDVTISAKIVEGYGSIINVRLEENSTGGFVNHTLTSGTDYYTYTILASQLDNQEYVGWRYYAVDNLGNLRVSEIYNFLVQNRAPQFIPSINDLSWIEDGGSQTIDLSTYFYDLDLDVLTYTAIITQTAGGTSSPYGGITVDIDNLTKIATISSTDDWNGDGTIVFYAWDSVGDFNTSNIVQVIVLADDNEAPTLTSDISPVNFSEDTTINLQLSCNPNDPGQLCLNYRYDENYIDYDENLIVGVDSSGQVSLSTELNWYGITYVKFEVDDNGVPLQTGSLVVKINVTPVNDNPLLDVPDVLMGENDPAPSPINLLSYTTDVDNVLTNMVYTLVSQSNDTLINCILNTNTINCGAPTLNSYGISDLIIEVIDGSGGFDTQKITIDIKQNHAPVITSYSPTYNPIIRTGNSQEFSVIAQDSDDPVLTYVWKVYGNPVGTNSNSYTHTPTIDGEFIISVEVSDDAPNTVTHEWTLTASSYPIANTFTGASTTDFSTIPDLSSASGVVLENDYGKIEFLAPLNLMDVFDLDNNVYIGQGVFAMNILEYPQLNKPARITLIGLRYDSIPKVFYSEQFTTNPSYIDDICDSCNLISYTGFPTTDGTLVFEVSHFSSFAVGGSGIKYNVSEFEDLETCEMGEQGNLVVEIEEPGDRDDFGVRDDIEIEVKVKNNADEDKKIIVEAYLYNVDEDEEVESVESDSQEIKDGRSEDFEMTMEVPDDFKEGDNYVLFVKAYEKGDEELQCSYNIIDIELEREEHDLIISEIGLDSSESYRGGSIEFIVEVENIGSEEEEEVYIIIEQESLGISEKGDLFDIEEYGEDDSYSERFKIKVPTTVLPGEYDFTIKVVYGSRKDSKLVNVEVLEQVEYTVITLDTIDLNPPEEVISLNKEPTTTTTIKKKVVYTPKNPVLTLIVALLIGIVIELSAIAIIRRYRKS